jgi:hypothetical protein
VSEEKVPVRGEEPVEGDHCAGLGTREHATGGGRSIALGDGPPRALPYMVHVPLKSLFEPWMLGEEGAGIVIVRTALPSIEEASDAHRIAGGVASTILVVTLAGASGEDDAAAFDVERLEESVNRDALAVGIRRSDPQWTTRVEGSAFHAMT